MFLFIADTYIDFLNALQFKYISCSYLSLLRMLKHLNLLIQIHLMFLFIYDTYALSFLDIEFKYISCSYLSELRRRQL